MPAYILTDENATEFGAVESPSPALLSPPGPGRFWFAVPGDVAENTVALVDGQVVPCARVVDPALPLSLAKGDARRSITRARDSAEFGFFTWDGSRFDANERSQARIQGALQLATLALATGGAFTVDWTLADNTVRTLSAQDFVGVGQALAAHVEAAHVKARALKAQIDAATSLEEVAAVVWV